MNYLTNIPDIVKDYGLCKVLLVRKEAIHFKHIRTVLFINHYKIEFNLSKFLEYFTQLERSLYNIDRNYSRDPNEIVSTPKDKFNEYFELCPDTKKLYLDKNLSYHFKNNMRNLYPFLEEVDVKMLQIENNEVFKFIISNEDLSIFWIYGWKTYNYKNKRIKNFSLYDK